MTQTVLHLAPHPDDELIGAPATLMALRDAGYRVVNLVCGLGKPDQHERRAAELHEASRLAGFDVLIPSHPPVVSSRDDVATVSAEVQELARATIDELHPDIVVSPTPHDRHPSHELVARALRDALLEIIPTPPRWWMWGLWGDLPIPTIGTAFEQPRLDEVLTALTAYSGELARNDYRMLVRGRAVMNAALAPEKLFGFGSSQRADERYVELLTETVLRHGRWLLGSPRWLEPTTPLALPSEIDIGVWLFAESITDMLGTPGMQRLVEPRV